MKKLSFALLIATTFLLSGCLVIDWYPVNLMIEVIDGQNHYMTSPEYKSSLEGTTIEYDGKVIPLDLDSYPLTRELPPQYEDQFFIGETYPFGNCLVFGELSGSTEFKDEPFKITWPDGSTDIITYTRKLNRMTVNAKETWKLNGKKCSMPIHIRKDF